MRSSVPRAVPNPLDTIYADTGWPVRLATAAVEAARRVNAGEMSEIERSRNFIMAQGAGKLNEEALKWIANAREGKGADRAHWVTPSGKWVPRGMEKAAAVGKEARLDRGMVIG